MKIEILGSGCPKCIATEEIVRKVVKKGGIKAEVGHVYDINKIIEYGAIMTPAVAINGKIKIQGKIPTIEEVEKIIKEELPHKQK
jgi:small redox-active disulfide protein 2